MSRIINFLALCSLFFVGGCRPESPSFKESSRQDSDSTSSSDSEATSTNSSEILEIEKEFIFSSIDESEQLLEVSNQSTQSSIKMSYNIFESTLEKSQINRKARQKELQGSKSQLITESFSGSSIKVPVDILFVVDNSGSMGEEHNNLSDKLKSIINNIKETDWKIAVVSTDENQKCLDRKIIDKNTPSPELAFKQAIEDLGTSGSSTEKGILMAVKGLSACENEKPWLRSNSHLATVIISDEDNCSNGKKCNREEYGNSDYLLNKLKDIRILRINAIVYGIIEKSRNTCDKDHYYGATYLEAISKSNGISESICNSNFESILNNISKNINNHLIKNLTLKEVPTDKSLVSVIVNSIELTADEFNLKGNTISLKIPLKKMDIAVVKYKTDRNTMKKIWELKFPPVLKSLRVKINGKKVQNYTVNTENPKSIEFWDYPEENSTIDFIYRKNQKLKKRFVFKHKKINPSTKPSLFLDGELVDPNEYSLKLTSKKIVVVFQKAPKEKKVVSLNIYSKISKKLKYKLSRVSGEFIEAKDKLNGAILEVSLEPQSNSVYFKEADFIEGREVMLNYEYYDELGFHLEKGWILESLNLTRNNSIVCSEQMDIQEDYLNLSSCVKAIGNGPISIKYTVKNIGDYIFGWPDLNNVPNRNLRNLKILVNGLPYSNFEILENSVVLKSQLLENDHVTLKSFYE